MPSSQDQEIATRLLKHLGARKFTHFVLQLREHDGSPDLHNWQRQALAAFERDSGIAIPREAARLLALLESVELNVTTLAEHELPSWLTIESLGGSCPVQASGTAGAWVWYFRARGQSWSIAATDVERQDPVDHCSNGEHSFYREELYEFGTDDYDAGYLPLALARFYITRELSRLRAERKIAAKNGVK